MEGRWVTVCLESENLVRYKEVEEEWGQGIPLSESHICGEGMSELVPDFDTG